MSSVVSETIVTNYSRSLDRQVDMIANDISEKKNEIKDPGLLGGKAGIVLFFSYLSNILPHRDHLQTVFDLLDDLGNSLSNDELGYNMSGGVAGIAFPFQHLRNIGILDRSEDLNLSEIDEFISNGIDNDFATGNWDPLHGMTGLGIYFLERNKETGERKFLEKIVDRLALMRKEAGGYKIWITPGYGKWSNDNYNFGMAHGMPGLLSFLAQVHRRGIRQKEIAAMISSCLPFLLKHEYREMEEYCFPNAIEVNPDEEKQAPGSRLAWCYGDLCIANALIHCGKAMGNDDWKTKGIDVALKTTQRAFENSGCMDAPFCHGSVGLMHQYNRFYKLTGNGVFKNAAANWLNITLEKFYRPGEGAGGYFFRCLNEEKNIFEYVPGYGLLEGSAGIALVYLSWLYKIEPDWDIIFLTNV